MTNEQIIEQSGVHPSECACEDCKYMCHTPCIPTPEDVGRLIDAGHKDKLLPTVWAVGLVWGTHHTTVDIIAPKRDVLTGFCVFRDCGGFCELHNSGLKPLEGKLAHHNSRKYNSVEDLKKSAPLLLIIESWEEINELLEIEL